MLNLAGLRRALMFGAVVLVVASCTAQYRNHGYAPLDTDLAQVVVGRDSKQTVGTLIGRPTAEGMSNQDAWYYVESRFRHYAYKEPEEIEREVLVISFDGAERVANIERFGLQDGRVIALSRRVTTSSVRDTTFLRQLLGNLGNFQADQFIN